jgi:tetratricopeptide (TPR) repeat protein
LAEFSHQTDDWDLLRNAVREPVRQMIAVEVDTAVRARQIIDDLLVLDPQRPHAVVSFDVARTKPEQFLAQAREVTHGWPAETGLLFLLDSEQRRSEEDELLALRFWQGMNLLREKWAALDGQTVFLLLPFNYRYLTTAADHLKRWISLKVHLRGEAGSADRPASLSANAPTPGFDLLSPDVARQRLASLEQELRTAIQRDEPPASFVRRYYLPILAAAVSLGELERAEKLRDKARGYEVGEAEVSQWLKLNIELEVRLFRMSEAERLANQLVDWAERHGSASDMAAAYFNLGRIALEQRDFPAAERWHLKSLAIEEKQGNEHDAASTYHNLGVIAQEQRDFPAAERWYLKSLAIEEKQGNEHGAAGSYHQLGRVAQERRDFATAERWYLKSLAIKEKQGDEYGAATTYHQLGRIAQEQRDIPAAERWYLKSLAIEERQGNEHGAASTYHQLGVVAQEQHDFSAAERWYLKSLAIEEKQGNEHGAAFTHGQLAHLAQDRGDYLRAGAFLLKALDEFAKTNDKHYAQATVENFARLFQASLPKDRAQLREMGQAALGDKLMSEIESAAPASSAGQTS